MKIMFICDTMGTGGAERVIATLSNGFVERGNNVSILMLSKEAKGSFYNLNDRVNLLNLNFQSGGFFKKAHAIKNFVVSEGPDMVISFLSYVCIYTWWALRRTKIPYIVSERNDPHQRGRLKQYLLNKSFKKAAGCVFQTEDACKWYIKVARNKSIIIYNPVKLDFLPGTCNERKHQVLYVGRFSEQKNIFTLVDAFKLFSSENPSFKLKMFGNGSLEDKLKQKVIDENLSDKVSVLPNSKTWQQDEFDSSLFLLTSNFEGMPNVLAEALCLGIPSVAVDCPIGGPKELKKLFPKLLSLSDSNPINICNKMKEMLLTKNDKCLIPNELEVNTIVDKWITFINDLLKKERNHV